MWILLILLYAPILIIVVYSFTEAKVLGNWTGFSFKLYESLMNTGAHHSLMNACINTIAIAFIAATVSTLLGSIAAIGIFNLRARSRKAVGFINTIPILNGDIITGISLFLLFVSLGVTQGFTTVVLAHITFCTPYVVLSVLPRLKQMNPNLYEALNLVILYKCLYRQAICVAKLFFDFWKKSKKVNALYKLKKITSTRKIRRNIYCRMRYIFLEYS